ncbi:MAG TPA: GNAT family N-acetyltransferase [Candidatus Acidoferrales bacterium]|nr:GNAT family N-acetyltransferase [Candidatus Acidoferrales bacterium]
MSSPTESRPQLSIRPAAEDDASAMREIFAEGVQDHLIPYEDQPRSREEIKSQITAAQAAEKYPILVADLRGWVLGWAALAQADSRAKFGDTAEVFVYVRRSFRNYGVGQQLMRALQEEAKRLSYRKLLGHVLAENRDSARLCVSCGWREVGKLVGHDPSFGERRDVIIMEFSIS